MEYKRNLVVRTWSGGVHFLPEERKYLRFSLPCPKCGRKNSFDVLDAIAGGINDQEENGLPFWYNGGSYERVNLPSPSTIFQLLQWNSPAEREFHGAWQGAGTASQMLARSVRDIPSSRTAKSIKDSCVEGTRPFYARERYKCLVLSNVDTFFINYLALLTGKQPSGLPLLCVRLFPF